MIDMYVDLYFMYFDCSYMLAFLSFKFVINFFITSMEWGTAHPYLLEYPSCISVLAYDMRVSIGCFGRGGAEILEVIVENKSEKDGQWLPYKQPAKQSSKELANTPSKSD